MRRSSTASAAPPPAAEPTPADPTPVDPSVVDPSVVDPATDRRDPAPATTGADEFPSGGRRYVQLVLVLGSLIALGPLTIDMYLPALPALAQDLAASDAAVQATLTGMLVGLGVGQLVIGPLSDAVGRRRPLLIGVTGHALTSVLCALAPDVLSLTVARTLQGLSAAAIAVVAMAVVRDLFSGIAAARLLSRLVLVMGVAPVLAPTIGGQVLRFTSWRGIFVTLALTAVVLVVVAARWLQETLPPHRRRSARPAATLRTYRWLLRDRVFVALALVGGLMFGTMFAYISGSPFVLQGIYGMDPQTYALVFGLNAVGIVVCSQLNPVLLRRLEPRQVLFGAVVAAAVSAVVLLASAATGFGGLALVLVPLGVIVAVCGFAFPNTPAIALSRHGEAAGTAAALLGAAQFGIGGLSAPLVGLLGTASAVPMAAVMTATTLTATVLLLAVRRPLRASDERATALA